MWKYVKKYLHFAILAGLCMVGEVLMDLIQPGLMSRIIDEGVLGLENGGVSDLRLIWSLGLRMILLVLFGGLSGSLNNVFAHLAAQNIGNGIRKDAFSHIMSFSFPQRDHYGTGSLVVRVTNDITQIQNFVSTFFRGLIRTSFLTFGSVFCMYRLNRDFGIIMICVLPFILGFLIFCLVKVNPLFDRLQGQLDGINEIMQEDVSGIRVIKACVRETYEKIRFGKANAKLIKTQLCTLIIFAFMNPVINALVYFATALILLAGARDVSYGLATPGTVMAAVTYTTTMLNGILGLVMLFQNLSRGLASWRRVKEILAEAPGMEEGKVTGLPENEITAPAVEFRDVSFTYPGSNHQILHGINLEIRKGETVAVMGVTGCGKTSLVSLIPRFYDATEGTVLVDGVDVRDYSKSALRARIAVVLQKSELFSTSIGENIAWGDEDAAHDMIQEAARTAQADEFISGTAQGYATMVAERGMSLSGGQKQRLSIARAVLKNAEIMIFDDATSALDLKTEADFYKALQEANPDATKIIVAQRIASVRNADRIVMLEGGRITAVGSHKELMATSESYRAVYRSQFGKEAADV